MKFYRKLTVILVAGLMGAAQGQLLQSGPNDSDLNALRLNVQSVRSISANQETYEAWPTLTRTHSGELLVVYSGGREGHIDPFGRLEMIRSVDNGETWSLPEVLADSPMDDRDAGVLESDKGTWLVTWFTSCGWLSNFDKAVAALGTTGQTEWTPEKIERWRQAKEHMTPENCPYPEIRRYMESKKSKDYGIQQWLIRSEDRGKTWSEPTIAPLMAPHGSVLTTDKRLLWAGKSATNASFIGVAESVNDGQNWEVIGQIPAASGHDSSQYHELHMTDTANGMLLAQIRNHNNPYHFETLQSESEDGGKTWTPAHSIGVWGFPSHLLRLSDGLLVMTYSHRGGALKPREDNQILARFSKDSGQNWSQAYVIAGKLPHLDFGYPSTVALPDGFFLTVWYQHTPTGNKATSMYLRSAQLMQAKWTVSAQ